MKRARRKIAAAALAVDGAATALLARINAGSLFGKGALQASFPTHLMAKVHEYILVAADGTCGVTKSNGPICFQQSRQEVGGHFESFDPQLGEGYTAQINEDGVQRNFKPNAAFEGVAGNVLIGRIHGSEMWGFSAEQQAEIRLRIKVTR